MTDLSPSSKLPSKSKTLGLVSVVITCYNQGRFLDDATESVLCQTYREFEIIIIDDGSTDNTAEVGCRRSRVRYVSQLNQGLSAARNRGIHEARGKFIVFLDADDRLLPRALEVGVRTLLENPECAFAFGDYREIAIDGAVISEPKRKPVNEDYYAALLRRNCIEMHAAVIYRRAVFENIGAFNINLMACEDYEFYLRVSRLLPICHYSVQVADYRQHDRNMSGDALLMLRSVLAVLRSQKKYVKHHPTYKGAYKEGLRSFAGAFAVQLVQQSLSGLCKPNYRFQGLKHFFSLCRYYPLGTLRIVVRFCIRRFPGASNIRSRTGASRG